MHYLEEEDFNETIYYCKSEDVEPRLQKVIREAEAVKRLMTEDAWHEMPEYQLLIRVLNEQADRTDDGEVVPKNKKDITPGSLQNPSDPDATFRSKAGKSHKGYVVNVIETVGEEGSLITGIRTEQNTYSDSQFCKDYIDQKEGDDPETMIADGAYGGVENQNLAEDKNINLVTTSLSGPDADPIFAQFTFNEEGTKV